MPADLKFWRDEIQRSQAVAEPLWPEWQTNIDYYTGNSADARAEVQNNRDWVNINADFYQVELKSAQLFFERPDLQLERKGTFYLNDPMMGRREAKPDEVSVILHAHKTLLNELLGPDHADVLVTVKGAIKDCLCPSGFGATKIGYEPTVHEVQAPEQLGDVLGLRESVPVPVHECWYWNRIPPKKFRIPADYHDSHYDNAPWLAMKFRMPLAVARRTFNIPSDYEGVRTRDEDVLNDQAQQQAASDLPYVDGVEIWYYASLFDEDVLHPKVMRRHVLIDGIDAFCEKDANSPYQTILPNGRLSGDSMIGNPIHPWTLRSVPDSAYPPSDCTMTRPLVRELCKFRTQMMQTRDANRPRILADASKLPPPVVAKIVDGSIGEIIFVEDGALAQGVGAIMAQVTQGTSPREVFIANDYTQRDLQQTLGIDAAATGIVDEQQESATKTAEVAKNRNVRMDAERRQALEVYLKGVQKFSALILRYMTPELAVPYIGEQAAMLWGAWDKQSTDGRISFDAKPDSQLRIDAAEMRKYWLDLYQFTAKDPNVVRVAPLKKLYELAGENPQEYVTEDLPEEKPEASFGFSFKGEDLYNPMAREVMAQMGIQISQESIDEATGQMLAQLALGGQPDPSGTAKPANGRPAQHGGTVEKVRPLSQQSADKSGQRSGPKAES